jgi:hypothetical protein
LSGDAESLAEHKKTSMMLQELVTIKHMLQAQQEAQAVNRNPPNAQLGAPLEMTAIAV